MFRTKVVDEVNISILFQ